MITEEDQGSQGSDQGLDLIPEPRVTLIVEEKTLDFLVDIGAQHSELLKSKGPMSSKMSWVQGATVLNNIRGLPKDH